MWRYMSLAAFVSVVQTKRLFFARLDSLEDPYEGRMLVPQRLAQYLIVGEGILHVQRRSRDAMIRLQAEARAKLCINCWHINEGESAAMWALYSKESGIAIQSTVRRLQQSFSAERRTVYVGQVEYYDFDQVDFVLPRRWMSLHMAKRKSFAHERELRAVAEASPDGKNKGVPVSVDPRVLIERIYVSPVAPNWHAAVVRGILQNYGLSDKEVLHSRLYSIADAVKRSGQ